jgi:hypothetical protein
MSAGCMAYAGGERDNADPLHRNIRRTAVSTSCTHNTIAFGDLLLQGLQRDYLSLELFSWKTCMHFSFLAFLLQILIVQP